MRILSVDIARSPLVDSIVVVVVVVDIDVPDADVVVPVLLSVAKVVVDTKPYERESIESFDEIIERLS